MKANLNYQEVEKAKEIFFKILDDEISNKMPLEIIEEAKKQDTKQQVGVYFMKFCAKWNLERMSQNPGDYAEFLNGQVG